MTELRRDPRLKVFARAILVLAGDTLPIHLLDVSRQGARVVRVERRQLGLSFSRSLAREELDLVLSGQGPNTAARRA